MMWYGGHEHYPQNNNIFFLFLGLRGNLLFDVYG